MNERILKLREQASQWVVANHQPQDPKTFSQKEIEQRYWMYEEKFAELIVKECMMIVEGFEITQEVALDEYVDYEASAVLKEHFGVEE